MNFPCTPLAAGRPNHSRKHIFIIAAGAALEALLPIHSRWQEQEVSHVSKV